MSNGKGDDPRPMDISKEEYDRNFERTFGHKTLRRYRSARNIMKEKYIDSSPKDIQQERIDMETV